MYREKLEKWLFSWEQKQNILSQMQKVHFLCFFSGTIDFLIIAQCKKCLPQLDTSVDAYIMGPSSRPSNHAYTYTHYLRHILTKYSENNRNYLPLFIFNLWKFSPNPWETKYKQKNFLSNFQKKSLNLKKNFRFHALWEYISPSQFLIINERPSK